MLGDCLLPAAWSKLPQIQEHFRQRMRAAADSIPAYLKQFSGRGTVMIGLGQFFAMSYVSIRMARLIGDSDPIELWGLPHEQLADWQRDALNGLGVTLRYPEVTPHSPLPTPHSSTPHSFRAATRPWWQLKAYAVLHSHFEQVHYRDADSYPIASLDAIWESQPYRKTGAVFFADLRAHGANELTAATWRILGMEPREERCFEGGHFFVDKSRPPVWEALWLSDWMNQRSDFYYQFSPWDFFGDKDTFHACWGYLGLDYAMPAPPKFVSPAFVQPDFDGKPLFLHRINGKLALGDGVNFGTSSQVPPARRRNDALPMEAVAWRFLDELRKLAPPQPAAAAAPIANRKSQIANLPIPIPLAGELLESLARKIGADKLARIWSDWTARPCGCSDRRKWLNELSAKLLKLIE